MVRSVPVPAFLRATGTSEFGALKPMGAKNPFGVEAWLGKAIRVA
jgi:hypothetical protein